MVLCFASSFAPSSQPSRLIISNGVLHTAQTQKIERLTTATTIATTSVALIAGRGRYISLFIDHRLKQDGKDLPCAESTQELEQTMASSDVIAGALFQPVAIWLVATSVIVGVAIILSVTL